MSSESQEAENIQHNLSVVRKNISDVSQRLKLTREPRLVAVSKTKPASAVQAAYDAGQRVFGENYVNELVEKAPELPADVSWHFIGRLQKNKINALLSGPWVRRLVVESVDSEALARALDKAVSRRQQQPQQQQQQQAPGPTAVASAEEQHEQQRQPLDIFLQVNTSGEQSKSGLAPSEVPELAATIAAEMPGLRLRGLMTIGAPAPAPPELDFKCLAATRDAVMQRLAAGGRRAGGPGAKHPQQRDDGRQHDQPAPPSATAAAAAAATPPATTTEKASAPLDLELSMGMSADYVIAVEHGSTNVRVGSTIFGPRVTAAKP